MCKEERQMENKEIILSVSDLNVKFSLRGKVLHALRGISLDLYKGEALAIVGESGSGKSVFTKTFAAVDAHLCTLQLLHDLEKQVARKIFFLVFLVAGPVIHKGIDKAACRRTAETVVLVDEKHLDARARRLDCRRRSRKASADYDQIIP